jgi:HAE1 family hydrophobic/amphiphilic exporter-1
LVRLAVERPVTALMLVVSIVLVGVIALQRLPLAFLPEVDVPVIVVTAPVPDSSPAQVEQEVTEPIEETLATLSGVKSMRSTSTADSASVQLEFDWGQSLDVVRMQVTEKLDLVRPTLPDSVRRIDVMSFNTSDIPVVEARISARGEDLSASYPLLETHVLDPLRRVPGVARVELRGVKPREVSVDLIHDRIREHRVVLNSLVDTVRKATTSVSLGAVHEGRTRYSVRGLGSLDSLEALENMPIGSGNLRLADVAEITYEEPPIRYGRHLDREPAIGLEVFKESTANTVDVVDAVNAVVRDEIAADPRLEGIELFVWEDQAGHIRAGIQGLQRAGLIGALMAIVCLYLFLRRLDSTLIVAMSIPFSVIAACGALYFLGKTLNLLSMMGLMLGVGMLVDNAIVVLEAIDRQRDVEPDPKRAAIVGAGSVTTAVVAATLTTLIVFLPLVLGASTELTTWLREMGMTISLALACSLVSSLILIPLVAARTLGTRAHRDGGGRTPGEPRASKLEVRYASLIAWVLSHRKRATAGLLVAFAIGMAPIATGLVRTEMFSATVNERLLLRYDFDDFHYKSQAEAAVDEVEEYLYEHADEFMIEDVYSWFAENEAGTVLVLERDDLSDAEAKELRRSIRKDLPPVPGVRVGFGGQSDDVTESQHFAVQLYGRDGEVLRELSEEALRALDAIDGLEDLRTSFQHGQAEIEVHVDAERASRRGFTPRDAADAFGFTLGGMPLPRYRDGEREVDAWLAFRIQDRASQADLEAISFPVQGELPVRVGEIAEFETVERPRSIVRHDRRGNAWVRGVYEGEDWEATRERIEKSMHGLQRPLGYEWSWDRRTLEQDQQDAQMGTNFLLALLLVYLVLASLFESLTQPIAILFSIVFAVPGAFWALALTDTPLNLMAQIGLLILMGIVVNNGVVYLDRVNQLRSEGVEGDEAFVRAGRDRLRPILMTVGTTVLGLVPLALGGSTVGGLFYFPLARAVMGGLLSSALFTLLGLPLITVGVEAAARWARRVWAATSPRSPV